ncbi:MAG: elongation factor G [Sphaerochaetaceae bacterium]|jgi:elongation factor G
MSVKSSDIRNIAIVGHNGTGKTSLLEQILFQNGVTSRFESVESGKTVSDYTEEEIQRKISIHAAMANLSYNDKSLTFIDTPGTADFIGEVVGAFRSCESAIVTVDARDGAQIETIKLWKRLNDRNKPRAVFMNKVDRERADFFSGFDHLKEQLDANYVLITIPMGSAENFKGVINLIEKKAYFLHAGEKESVGEIPQEFASLVEEYESALIEAAAEGSDELMEKYFEEGTLSIEDIRSGLTLAFDHNSIVPVFAGSSALGSGIANLLTFISESFPSPLGKEEFIIENEEEKAIEVSESGSVASYVFKTTIDQFSGKLAYVKVVRGSISGDTELYNPEMGKKEKAGKVFRMVGKKLIETDKLVAGDIGVIARSSITATNASLVSTDTSFTFRPLRIPSPVYSLAIEAGDKKSEDKMNESLYRITEEDLTFQIRYNDETRESTISGMGELHLNQILDKVQERQKITINTRLPKIAYRETITKKSGIVEYAHKKQSGGHGQYGKVHIEIEPIERGEYYSFTNAIKGGAVSKGYMPGIEKGLIDAMEEGFLAGYPLVDIGVTLVDGKEHSVDSSEMAFRLAAKGAMKIALEKAGPVILEPFMKLEVYIEDKYLGDILSDLSGKRGRVQGQDDMGGGVQMVKAEVPQAEMRNYSIDLKSMTSGTGSFEIEFDHYEMISGRIADDVIKEAKAAKEE